MESKVWVFFVAHLWNLSKYFFHRKNGMAFFPDGRSFVRMEVFASDLLTLRLLRQGNAIVNKWCPNLYCGGYIIYIYKAWPMTWARCAEYPFASFATRPIGVGITWNDQLWPVGIWSWWNMLKQWAVTPVGGRALQWKICWWKQGPVRWQLHRIESRWRNSPKVA